MTQPPVDAQALTELNLDIFEAIATIEYTCRRPTRSAIAQAAHLDEAALAQALAGMAEQGLITVTLEDGEAVYLPARRDWSTQPDQAAGHPME